MVRLILKMRVFKYLYTPIQVRGVVWLIGRIKALYEGVLKKKNYFFFWGNNNKSDSDIYHHDTYHYDTNYF